jgi:hypothetical protein
MLIVALLFFQSVQRVLEFLAAVAGTSSFALFDFVPVAANPLTSSSHCFVVPVGLPFASLSVHYLLSLILTPLFKYSFQMVFFL